MFKPYPITVEPILKEQIWGGTSLSRFVKIPHGKKVGEAWFLADQAGNDSTIANGEYKGTSLGSLMRLYAGDILGPDLEKKYGKKFPLLFKFIDSRDKLSVQVHPDDKTARRHHSGSGKTEAWYVVNSGWGAYVMLGFRHFMNKDRIARLAGDGRISREMKKYATHRGDAFLIPAGTVHSIGPSNLIFEIQQNSDVTYRLYDWDRKNLGIQRELHIGSAADAVKFEASAGKFNHKKIKRGGIKIKPLASCRYFSTSEALVKKGKKYFFERRAVLVIALVEGEIEISTKTDRYRFKKGAVILAPYKMGGFVLKAVKKSKFVATEVK
jgi:mannose-6-phosphate isomerase